MPSARPGYRPTPFAKRLESHMCEWRARVDGSRHRYWRHWTDGIYPAYRELAETAVAADEASLHNQAAHLRSSQTFAFNLFLPFREGRRTRLSEYVSTLVDKRLTIDRLQFEWTPPGGLLGEIAGDRPVGDEPATAADVVLWGRLTLRRHAAVLLEVKLSEDGFTHCGGRESRGNRRKDVCCSANLFFAEPRDCYLQRTKYAKRDRRYWEIFTRSHGGVRKAFPNADLGGPCPFAFDMQQPMRNLAIARGMEQEGLAHRAWFALCAHDANPNIAAHWREWSRLLPKLTLAPVLSASEVISIGEAEGLTDWATYMRERYQL